MKPIVWVVNILVGILGTQASANVLTDEPVPIGHCYHWLQTAPGYLEFKYSYAKDNGNELTFYTSPATSNGSVAGPGLYCAKSPSGSYGYGDRIIRIEFVSDVVILDAQTGRNYCGENGRFYANDAECQSKDPDVKLYNRSPDWYVIQNPRAVKSWSATTPELIRDLNAEMSYADGGYKAHAQTAIRAMESEVSKTGERNMVNARARMGFAEIVKSEKLLRSLPALTILAEFNRPENKKINAKIMAKVLESTVIRVLEDDFLPWSDVKPVIKSNAKIKQAFVDGIQKQLANFAAKPDGKKNFDVMLLFAGQKDSGVTPEQIQFLIGETFKNPSNFGQTRFVKGDLSEGLKKGLVEELSRRLKDPRTKNDISLLASLVTFVSINNIDAQIRTDVTALFYEHLKSLTAAKFYLADRKTKYPLGDTTQIATQLCQANIAAYNLVNKDLSIISGDLRISVGQLSNLSNAAAFCNQQASLMDVMATIPKAGDAKIHILKGTINNLPFKFLVLDQESTEPQVRSFLKKNQITSMSEISITVDKEESYTWNNYSAWGSEDEIVTVVVAQAASKGVYVRNQLAGMNEIAEKSKGKSKKIDLVFESIPVTIKADYIEDFDEQCKLLGPTLDTTTVSQISFTLKDESESISGEWKSATESCYAIRPQLLKAGVTSLQEKKALAEIARLRKGKKKNLTVEFEEYTASFAYNNVEDLEEQCNLLAPRLENYTVNEIEYTDDEEFDGDINGLWTKTSDTCGALKAELLERGIPSKKYLEAVSKIAALGRGKSQKLTMNFEALEVNFKVDSIEDFEQQCALLSPALDGKAVNTVSFSLNDQSGYTSASPAPWTKAKDSCDGIRGALKDAGLISRKDAAVLATLRNDGKGKAYQIDVQVAGTAVQLGADNMEDLTVQCARLGKMFDNREINYPSYKVNKEDFIIQARALDSTKAVCEALTTAAHGTVLPKVLVDLEQQKLSYRYGFTLTWDGLPIPIGANDKKDLKKSCVAMLKLLKVQQSSEVYISKNEFPLRHVNFAGETDSCNAIIANAKDSGFIPSAEQEEILALKKKYTVRTVIDGIALTFKVDNRDQLFGQCLNLLDEHPGVRVQYFKVIKKSKDDFEDLWGGDNVREACQTLSRQVP